MVLATVDASGSRRRAASASRADVVHWGGLRLEVVDIDGTRVDRVLVTAPDAPPTEDVTWKL